MATSNDNEVEYQLGKLITRYSDLFAYHQWPSEHERWVELIFALACRISDKSESEIRAIIETADDYGLLDVKELANIRKAGNIIDYNYPTAKRVIEALTEPRITEEGTKEAGLTKEEAKSCLTAMYEAAISLTRSYDGKIQKYLRKYGEIMVKEFTKDFAFSGMDKKAVNHAVTYWLQNVCNMPVHLETDGVKAFCQDMKITSEKLVKEADNLDINLALLDDMIDEAVQSSK